jgi:lipoate---protein ligase
LQLIVSDNTDIYFNLAAEDYLLHHTDKDILMLWRSKNAVVCGKHQNLCAEINYGYCKQNNIDISRRLTGGGTVYHDLGNINFSFIKTIDSGLEYAVDYRRFLDPIKAALLAMGVPTDYSLRNDLLLHGKKISGNAEHVLQQKKRVLHHGTLLFNSHLKTLGQTLHSNGHYIDKAVRSVRSEVTNIADHYLQQQSPNEFMNLLVEYFTNQKHTNRYVLNLDDENQIQQLMANKYVLQDWIMGYSPNYVLKKSEDLAGKTIEIELEVKKGMITHLSLQGHKEIIDKIALSHFINQPLTEALSEQFAHALRTFSPNSLQYFLF